MTALKQLLYMIEKGEMITPDDKKKLVEMEKKQLFDAYNLDPELMKIRFKTPHHWYTQTYGYKSGL